MHKLKLMTIVGTRPEIIKLSEVIKKCDIYFEHILVHTDQNYDYTLNEVFFVELDSENRISTWELSVTTSVKTMGNIPGKNHMKLRLK